MKTAVTELLGIEYPIIQGGMAWVGEYHLAAAVSEAGGLGIIGAASAPATSSATVLVVCVGLKYATRTIDGITVPLFSDNPTMILLFMPGWRSPNDEEPGGRGCRALQSGGAGESRPVNGMSYVVARSRSS